MILFSGRWCFIFEIIWESLLKAIPFSASCIGDFDIRGRKATLHLAIQHCFFSKIDRHIKPLDGSLISNYNRFHGSQSHHIAHIKNQNQSE
jgi:hypothetical protein